MFKKNIIYIWWTFFKESIYKNKNFKRNFQSFNQFNFKLWLVGLYFIKYKPTNQSLKLNIILHFFFKKNVELYFNSCKILSKINLLKYELSFFFRNWKIIEKLTIPWFLWFNKFFFFKKKKFILTLIDFLIIMQNNIIRNTNKYLFEWDKIIFEFKFINLITQRLQNIFENFESINKIFLNIKFYKSCCLNNLLSNSIKFNRILSKDYSAYQAFLNTHLYLIWNFLFVTNISTQAYDFLFLRNLNKYFFWVGDKSKNFQYTEFSTWGVRNVFFRKGLTYHDFKFYKNKNTFIPFYSFYKLPYFITEVNENYKNFNNFLLS